MDWEIVVQKIPDKKPDVCIGQIHDKADDILEVRVEGEKLVARGKHINGYIKLLDNFFLQKPYKFQIAVINGNTSFYNYESKTRITLTQIPKNVKGCYFKVGNYVQSNPTKGDLTESIILLKSAQVSHLKKPPLEPPPPPIEELPPDTDPPDENESCKIS